MGVSLVAAQRAHLPLLESLFQFYHYDFAELLGGHVGPEGRFSTPSLEAYWQDAWRHPFLVRVDEHPAGFALVQRRSRITGDADTWDMAEFFVMRQHRRAGVGSRVAIEIFDRLRGKWEIREVSANKPATAFWRAVVSGYTGGHFTEVIYDDERWRGPVQAFDNTAR
jgi:predicted acetyltransferase